MPPVGMSAAWPASRVKPGAWPMRVSINFDDGRKDSLLYGTQVAREFNLVFSHHIPCGYILQNHPFIISWKQLADYAADGHWDFGSHFMDGAILTPLDATGRVGRALPNLIWRKGADRLETPEEYAARIEYEFSESRKLLRARTGQTVNFISYPFGDIGQETDTNMQNPIPALIETGRRYYDAGFLQSRFGYAVAGDDPMFYQRHEMERWMDGSNVVDYVYAQHPVFLARRLRAETAALEGRQYRALENVEWLEKNGYPPALLDATRRYVETRLSGGFVRPAVAAAGKKSAKDVDTLKPRLRVEGEHFRDNQDRTHWRVYGGGGVNLGERLALDGKVGIGRLRQDVETFTNGVIRSRRYDVDEQSAGARLTLQFVPDPARPAKDYLPQYVSAGLMQRQYSGDADGSIVALEAETQFRPILPLDVMLRFERDMVPGALAAVEEITYEEYLGTALYRLRDWWELSGAGAHFAFSDDNARDHLNLGTHWLLHERTGFRAGLRYNYVTSDEERAAYWTPYRLQRYLVEGQFRGSYLRHYYNLRAGIGLGREAIRDEEQTRYEEATARARRERWRADAYPERPTSDWEPVFSASAATRLKLRDRWEANGEISYNKNPEYEELTVFGGLTYYFKTN